MKGSDTKEMIEQCLQCVRKRCVNCLERVPKESGTVIERIDPETGEVTATYPSYAEAGRQNKLHPDVISRNAAKSRLYAGYYWKLTVKE